MHPSPGIIAESYCRVDVYKGGRAT